MTVDFEKMLTSVWPDWQIVELVGISDATSVYKARRQDIVGLKEASICVTSVPETLDEIDDLRMSGLGDDAVRLHLERLVRESVQSIQAMESVKGEANIQQIEDYKVLRNEKTGQWFVIVRMELLMPLRKRMQLSPFSEEDIIRLGIDMCSAMEKCHRRSIIHRNIEPGSIYIDDEGRYKLGNFDRARTLTNLSQEETLMQYPNYIAPEVFNRMKAAPDMNAYVRTDIYSLGLVLYYLANNGKMPFIPQEKQIVSPADREDAIKRRLSGEPLPGLSRVSPETEAVILKACAFRMEDRYATAAEMRRALLKLAKQEEPVQDATDGQSRGEPVADAGAQAYPVMISMEELLGKPDRRRKPWIKWGTVILCVLLALILACVGCGVIHRSRTEKDAAQPTVGIEERQTESAEKSITVPGFMNEPVHVSIKTDDENRIVSMTVDTSSQVSDRSRVCEEAAFINQFIGQTGPFAAGENIDVCTGATYTSTAIIAAVNQLQ